MNSEHKKVGRPKGTVKENHKQYKTFSVACLYDEWEIITQKAKEQNKTISRLLIDNILSK